VREFGCQYGQGNLLGRPMTTEELTRRMACRGVERVPDHLTSRV